MISYVVGKLPMVLTAIVGMIAFVLTGGVAVILCVVPALGIMTVFPMYK